MDHAAFVHESKYVVVDRGNSTSALYNEMDLAATGLSKQAFAYACKGYESLLRMHKLARKGLLAICDFSQSSNRKRLYVLDMDEKKVLITSYVAHGRNSGGEFANRFSNRTHSNETSLGFYITSNTYNGENGLSLKLTGVDKGFNDLAAKRNIVMHGADYIGDEWGGKYMGRSYGCPAVPIEDCSTIIELIRGGACLFIYHPTKKYLQHSKILNG
jgi:hypothetical protein